ncbi:MAG: hypothetical protein LAQ69_40850 [Acidobacteriia bacterium]|nr:hypothetical protein [Terriglobia bacterium]
MEGTSMAFNCTKITFHGECKITGTSADNPKGWTLGFIQLQFINTDWVYYRGQSNADGSSFLQFARPPALPKGGCRDTVTPGAIFIDNNTGHDRTVAKAGAAFPISMSAEFPDAPARIYDLSRKNGKTKKANFLQEAQIELHFCTVLSLMSPAGVYQHVKSVYWNVHWQYRFQPTNFGNLSASWTKTPMGGLGNMAKVGKNVDGPPTDSRFSSIITSPATPNCNLLTVAAHRSPNVKESDTWVNFDVTH